MHDRIIEIGDGFWNIRGSFKFASVFDVGTQMSLVRLTSGEFVLLDSYTLSGDVRRKVLELTDGGKAISAIVNLHPFHTVHVPAVAAAFPHARLFGTRRHVDRAPTLRWESIHSEDPEMEALFSGDISLSVPRGVDFIPKDEKLHFSSVLAFHHRSHTLHVDDTLGYWSLPFASGLAFHPSLRQVLQKRPGAADEFRDWCEELIERCRTVDHLCTAHLRSLPPSGQEGGPISERVEVVVKKSEGLLGAHKLRYD